MKKISNIKDEKLREEQFDTLANVFETIKGKDDIVIFLFSFLTDSEKAYLGQRLNIMRMLAKNFNYAQIREKLNASNGTISNAQKCLDRGGDQLKRIVLQYKFKPKTKAKTNAHDEIMPFVSQPHYPGSILK